MGISTHIFHALEYQNNKDQAHTNKHLCILQRRLDSTLMHENSSLSFVTEVSFRHSSSKLTHCNGARHAYQAFRSVPLLVPALLDRHVLEPLLCLNSDHPASLGHYPSF